MGMINWNPVKDYLKEKGIKPFPSKNGVVIAETYEDDNNETIENFDSVETLVADVNPLLPDGYRITVLPDNRRYDSNAVYIGPETDLVDVCFDKMS